MYIVKALGFHSEQKDVQTNLSFGICDAIFMVFFDFIEPFAQEKKVKKKVFFLSWTEIFQIRISLFL